ncbi:hypothetical protein GJ496_000443 [Pomphorhynchus laevis]|nr:hypothetical protein GJ496_000443 [Pomphorhynchus laevis]
MPWSPHDHRVRALLAVDIDYHIGTGVVAICQSSEPEHIINRKLNAGEGRNFQSDERRRQPRDRIRNSPITNRLPNSNIDENQFKRRVRCWNCGKLGHIQRNCCSDINEGFHKEIEEWIQNGILVKWPKFVKTGIIPLLAVRHASKNKVRPIMDFRELNAYLSSHIGSHALVYEKIIRIWRRVEGPAKIVDLKNAYLQIHVAKEFWKYQLVNYNNQTYFIIIFSTTKGA